jgi:hypothetical protein
VFTKPLPINGRYFQLPLSNRSKRHTAPSLRLFVLNGYRCIVNSSLSRAALVMSVISFTFLPVAWFSQCLLSNCCCCCCSLLKAECFPPKVPASRGSSPSSCFPDQWGAKYLEWPMFLHLLLLLCVQSLLSFRRGLTPTQCPVTRFSNPSG